MPLHELSSDAAQIKTRVQILQCAIDLIKKNGYNKVTIPQICKAAGVTKSTFYYHFTSKDDLLQDFTNQLGLVVRESYPNILLQDSFIKQVWEVFHVYFVKNIEAGALITRQVFVSYLNEGNQRGFPETTYAWDIAVNLIKKAKDAGQITNPNTAEDIANAAYELARGICVTWSIENGSFDLCEVCKNALRTLFVPAEGFEF